MSYPSEKRDSFTGITYEVKALSHGATSASPSDHPRSANLATTQPQSYYLQNTKTDWVFKGAYSLRLAVDDASTEVWNVKISSKALEIFRPNGSLVGTAGLHNWSSRVEIAMNDAESISEFELKKKGFCCITAVHVFQIHGRTFTWKRASKLTSKFQLNDEAGNHLAWIGATSWRGRYKFELIQAGLDIAVVEAILVSALAILENEKRTEWAGATASANSAAVSVAVS